MDNFGSSEEGNLDHLGACGGVPNMHGAGDDEIASDAHGKFHAMAFNLCV